METDKLIEAVKEWGREKGLTDGKAQLNKVIEEVGEIAHEVTRNKDGKELEDSIGDSLVTIIVLADIYGKDPIKCLELAYNEIKNRKGETKNGTFVKSESNELGYVAEEPLNENLMIGRIGVDD